MDDNWKNIFSKLELFYLSSELYFVKNKIVKYFPLMRQFKSETNLCDAFKAS